MRLGAIHHDTQVAGVILTTRLLRPHSRGVPILQQRGLPAHGILLPGRGSECVVGLVELGRCSIHRFDFLIALRLRVDFSKRSFIVNIKHSRSDRNVIVLVSRDSWLSF